MYCTCQYLLFSGLLEIRVTDIYRYTHASQILLAHAHQGIIDMLDCSCILTGNHLSRIEFSTSYCCLCWSPQILIVTECPPVTINADVQSISCVVLL